jgi:endonuclease G
MRFKRSVRIPLVSLLVLGLIGFGSACMTPQVNKALRVALYTALIEQQAGFTPQQLEWIGDNCAMGMPIKQMAFGETKIIPRKGFVLEHSSERRIALWVAESITQEELTGPYNRDSLADHELGREPFRADDRLDPAVRAELSDYRAVSSEYARGHMSPVGNFKNELDLLADTFVLSNMVPQERHHNSTIWASLEGRCRAWARARDPVYVNTGGFFYDPEEEDPSTADGLVEFWVTDSDNMVYIPTHLYKVAIAKDQTDQWHGCAIVLENRSYGDFGIGDLSTPEHIKSIDWVEQRTGLDFFPDLPDSTEDRVEAEVPVELWPTSGPPQ